MSFSFMYDFVSPLATTVGTLLLMLFTKALTARWKRLSQQGMYNSWIARARKERDLKAAKLDKVLYDENNVNEDDGEDESYAFMTVAETVNAIAHERTLDPVEHVQRLARRCRKYGRGVGMEDGGVNAIAEECYDEAFEAAQQIKRILETSNKKIFDDTISPLFGVPISVKESIGIKGFYSTGGLACRLVQRKTEDSLVIKVLRHAGGVIPLCTGNVPQLLMMAETTNHIWGRTRNPWDLTRSVGGSTGGDAALVAMGCVPLAVGSDVGGSIRIPACFTGIVGFKPTAKRITFMGCIIPRKDDKSGTAIAIPSVIGSLSRTVDCAERFCKAVWTNEMFDVDLNVPPFPFKDEVYQAKRKLKFGYFETDDWFEPCATSKRALQETIDGLIKAGHTCQPFKPPTDGWHNYGVYNGIYGHDGNLRSVTEALEGEACVPEYNFLYQVTSIPNLVRFIILRFKFLDQRRRHLMKMTRSGGLSAWEYGQLTADLLIIQNQWSDAFVKANIDALIFPAMPIPAILHKTGCELTSILSYMFLANLLRWPTGTVPVTTVRPGSEEEYPLVDLPENQRDYIANLVAKGMKGSAGMPMSISVMTPPYRDEMCLYAMKQVETVVSFKERPKAYKIGVSKL